MSNNVDIRPAQRAALWAVRIAYLIVFVINVMCALQFCFLPESYMGAYQLSSTAGAVAVQGIGVAFLMWNCTYPLVIVNPLKHRTLCLVVLAQQIVGLVGESLILSTIPAQGYAVLQSSILRFIAFDGGGLIIMAATTAWLFLALRKL